MLSRPRSVLLLSLALALPAPARAAEPEAPPERAEAQLFGGAINRFVEKKLPVTLELPGDRAAGVRRMTVTVTEARFCGAAEAGRGRLIAVVRAPAEPPATPAVAVTPLLTGAADCQAKLEDVAHRRPPADAAPLAVVEVLAAWAPWELKLSLGNVAASGEALAAALGRARNAGPLAAVETSGLRLASERGGSLSLDLALAFTKANDAVTATLTPATATPTTRGGRDARPALLDPAAAPSGADGIVGATYAFANRVLTLFGQDGPILLEIEHEVIELRGLQLAGTAGAATLRARATARSVGESMRLTAQATGNDLTISEIRAEPELEDCGQVGIGCRVRNTARSAAAAAAAAGLTARYKGQLLREIRQPPPFSFDAAGQSFTLKLTPTRTRASAAGLIVYGKATLE
jgi:hypothetical protein